MENPGQIKQQLIAHLKGGEAFVSIEELLKSISYDSVGKRPANLPYSFYEVFYHIWFTQKDIIDYCMSEVYNLPEWPKDYWPLKSSPESENSWMSLQKHYFQDRKKFSEYILNPDTNLMTPLPNGNKHNLLREIVLVIEHSAYHTGQLLVILRELGLYGISNKQ